MTYKKFAIIVIPLILIIILMETCNYKADRAKEKCTWQNGVYWGYDAALNGANSTNVVDIAIKLKDKLKQDIENKKKML